MKHTTNGALHYGRPTTDENTLAIDFAPTFLTRLVGQSRPTRLLDELQEITQTNSWWRSSNIGREFWSGPGQDQVDVLGF